MKNPLRLKTEARDEAYEYFDKNIRTLTKTKNGSIDPTALGLEDNDIDAFRHAYVSGVFTQEYGESAADAFGQLNEFFNFGSSSSDQERATNMDLWNNSIGRRYGKQTHGRELLLKKIHKALKKGELITDPKDPRQYKEGRLTQESSKTILVLKEDESGRNTTFFDVRKQTMFSLDEFVIRIKSGEYPDYEVRHIHGVPTPVSKPDRKSGNNLG